MNRFSQKSFPNSFFYLNFAVSIIYSSRTIHHRNNFIKENKITKENT
jgi:hypothetical protein